MAYIAMILFGLFVLQTFFRQFQGMGVDPEDDDEDDDPIEDWAKRR